MIIRPTEDDELVKMCWFLNCFKPNCDITASIFKSSYVIISRLY